MTETLTRPGLPGRVRSLEVPDADLRRRCSCSFVAPAWGATGNAAEMQPVVWCSGPGPQCWRPRERRRVSDPVSARVSGVPTVGSLRDPLLNRPGPRRPAADRYRTPSSLPREPNDKKRSASAEAPACAGRPPDARPERAPSAPRVLVADQAAPLCPSISSVVENFRGRELPW